MQKISPFVLRLGLGLVFIWFGTQQLIHTSMWVGMIPDWTSFLPFTKYTLVLLNGWFEVVFALLLISGFYTRIVSLLLALHLFGITYTLGYGPIAVRDFGLSVAILSVFLYGADYYSFDRYFADKSKAEQSII